MGLLLFVSFLCILLTATPTASADSSSPDASSSSQSDVQTVKVGIFEFPGYVYEDESGVWCGIDVEYVDNIAQHAGFTVEFVVEDNLADALHDLDNGTIDMLIDVTRNDEFSASYLFSAQEQGETPGCLVAREDDDRFNYGDVAQLANVRIAVDEGPSAVRLSSWCSDNGISPEIVEYPSYGQTLEALASGNADVAFVGANFIEGYRTVDTLPSTPYYFVFRGDSLSLKRQVDSAMEEITLQNPFYLLELDQKYLGSGNEVSAAFTAAEKAYITAHPNITVAVLEGDEPYYATALDGTPKGVIPEYYTEISSLTGLNFTFKTYNSQSEAIAAVISGEADILGMYSDGLPYANAAGLTLTNAYTTVDTVLITRTGTERGSIRTIAVKERSRNAFAQKLTSEFDADFVGYDNAAECFAALRRGDVDAMICGLPSATWLINQTNSSAFSTTSLSSTKLELCGAIAPGNPTLYSIMNKAIAASSGNIDEIVASNTLPENTLRSSIARIPPLWLVVIVGFLVVLVIGLIVAFVQLRRHAKEKEELIVAKADNERRAGELAAKEQSAEEKNRFFSDISHDMRTPLNAIMGFTRLGLEAGDVEEKDDYLDKVGRSSELLLNLIDDTLTISKSNSGKLTLDLAPVTSSEIIETVSAPIRQSAASRGIEFDVDDTQMTTRTIIADKLAIEKVALNLLSNAVKYTPAGGHVRFIIRNEPQHSPDADTVLIVSDDGIGMSAEFQKHLFEPFSQEQRTGYEGTGTGLGLSIVKQLVDLMGGTIDVYSAQGQGTVFTIRLHLKPADTSQKAQETAADKPSGKDGSDQMGVPACECF